jgi:hypothetical protein
MTVRVKKTIAFAIDKWKSSVMKETAMSTIAVIETQLKMFRCLSILCICVPIIGISCLKINLHESKFLGAEFFISITISSFSGYFWMKFDIPAVEGLLIT